MYSCTILEVNSCINWRNELLNLLARVGTVGKPTWFITLSAADLQREELYTML